MMDMLYQLERQAIICALWSLSDLLDRVAHGEEVEKTEAAAASLFENIEKRWGKEVREMVKRVQEAEKAEAAK